jgi:hypothetical protein
MKREPRTTPHAQTILNSTMPGNSNAPTVMDSSFKRPGIMADTRHVHDAGRVSSPVKIGKLHRPVLSAKALKDWIIDKGFDGVSTQSQRDGPRDGKSPKSKNNRTLESHYVNGKSRKH